MTNQDETTLAEGKFLRLRQRGKWEYAERIGVTGTVSIVPITADGCLLLTEQYRVPMQAYVIELPAGLAGDVPGQEEEQLASAAKRELLEETGYEAETMIHLETCPTSPGLSTEEVTYFLADQLKQVHDGGGDEHEDIVVHKVPLAELDQWLAQMTSQGKLVSGLAYAGLYLYHRHLRSR